VGTPSGIPPCLQWESDELNPPDPELKRRLIGLVEQLLGPGAVIPRPFPLDQQLSDLGLTSLKMVNLMLAVEMEFDIMISQADITPENFQNLRAIARLVAQTLDAAARHA
jgi:acyl carrier protein